MLIDGVLKMSLMKEVQQLETELFNALEAAYRALEVNDFDKAKTFMATTEILNEDYKEITYVDFVSAKTILTFYERLWEKQQDA